MFDSHEKSKSISTEWTVATAGESSSLGLIPSSVRGTVSVARRRKTVLLLLGCLLKTVLKHCR